MLTKTTTAIAAALLISSTSLAFAAFDGDSNPIPGSHQQGAIVEQSSPGFMNAYASTKRAPSARRQQLDGDSNPVPGSH